MRTPTLVLCRNPPLRRHLIGYQLETADHYHSYTTHFPSLGVHLPRDLSYKLEIQGYAFDTKIISVNNELGIDFARV